MNRTLTPCLLLTLLPAALPAQKMLTGDGTGRIVQLFDLHTLRDATVDPSGGTRLPAPPQEQTNANERVAALLRTFVDPPLQPGDELRPLGDRWLALLGTAQQAASLDRLWQVATRRKEDVVQVEIELFTFDAKAFATVQPKLVTVERPGGVGYEAVVDKDGAKPLQKALLEAGGNRLEAPRLAVFPLQRAAMSMQSQTAYVKDFTLERQGDLMIADPVVDTVWDGNQVDVIAAWQPDGLLGLAVDVHLQELQKPIPTFTTTLVAGLPPVQIQLPRVTGVRLRQTAVLGADSLAVLAAPKADGTWFVATLRAKALP